MRLNPFKRDPAKKEKTAIFKEIKAETGNELKAIENIADPAERVRRYEAVGENLQKFYNDGKPVMTDLEQGFNAAIFSGIVGGAGAFTAVFTTAAVPYIALPAVAIAAGLGGMFGGVGLGTLFGGRHNRKEMRAEHGTVRNAMTMHKLQTTVEKRIEKDSKIVRSLARNAKLREDFNDTYRKKGTAPAPETVADEPVKVRIPAPRNNRQQPTLVVRKP